MIGVLTLVVALAALVVFARGALRLVRMRRGDTRRQDVRDELVRLIELFALEGWREMRVFSAHKYFVWGTINAFRVECELWDHARHPFIRVTVYFPRSLRQGLQIFPRTRHRLLERLARGAEQPSGLPSFDQAFVVGLRDAPEHVASLLDASMRANIERLDARADDFRVGDESLFACVGGTLDVTRCEQLIRESMALAAAIFHRSVDLGPGRTSQITNYEQAESALFSREATDVVGGAGGSGDTALDARSRPLTRITSPTPINR